MNKNIQTAIFAGGCFWCTEAVFQDLKGVISVLPGYTGGNMDNPTYERVSGGNTGHVEAIKIEYDESIISFDDLLSVFFNTHDPTTLNRQGNDVGTQYKSAIFYTDEGQKIKAENIIKELNDNKAYDKPVVTEVKKFEKFFEAEDYHKNYYKNNKKTLFVLKIDL